MLKVSEIITEAFPFMGEPRFSAHFTDAVRVQDDLSWEDIQCAHEGSDTELMVGAHNHLLYVRCGAVLFCRHTLGMVRLEIPPSNQCLDMHYWLYQRNISLVQVALLVTHWQILDTITMKVTDAVYVLPNPKYMVY